MTSISKLIAENGEEPQRWQCPEVEEEDEFIHPTATGRFKGPLTAEKIERIQQMAYKEAYDDGLKKGYEQGEAKLRAKLEQQANVVTRLLNTLARPIEQLDEEVEQQLVELALIMTRQMVRREIKTEPGEVVAIVKEAIAALPVVSKNVHIHLHPDDIAMVKEALSVSHDETQWHFVEDVSLTRGDCRVVTDASSIDATLENRLTAMVVNMLGGARAEDGDAGQADRT